MVNFTGSWKKESDDNLDVFLKKMGVSWAIRKVAGAAKPQQDISQDDANNTLTVTTKAMKTKKSVIKIQTEAEKSTFDDEFLPTGAKLKCHAIWESNDVLAVTSEVVGTDLIMVAKRSLSKSGANMIITATINGEVQNTSIFNRVE